MKNSEPVNYTAASHVAVPLDTREIRCAPDRRKSRRFQRLLKCNEYFKQQCALSIRESYGKNTVCDACGYDQLSCLQKSEKMNNKDPNRQSTKLGDIDIRSAVLPGKSTGSCVGLEHSDTESDSGLSVAGSCGSQRPSSPTWLKPGKCVAIDCEMVGTGPGGRIGELARCSVVNYAGNVIFDKYIQPELPITDYRTRWSGITRNHMKHAVPFKTAQKEILNLLKDKRVVGHALHNDFKALKYVHPNAQTRDTSKMPLLKKKAEIQAQHNVSLKTLAWCLLKKNIQGSRNGHCSIEDAQTSMELYKLVEDIWEQKLLHHCSQSKSSLESCVMDGNNYMEDRYWPPDLEEKN